MDIEKTLIESFPKTIDPSKENFSALVASSKGQAAIATILKDCDSYVEKIKIIKSIFDLSEFENDDFFNFFSAIFLPRKLLTDKNIIATNIRRLFQRKGRKEWGTIVDTKALIQEYFNKNLDLYVIENLDYSNNLIQNPYFNELDENESPKNWGNDGNKNVIMLRHDQFAGDCCAYMPETEDNHYKIIQNIEHVKKGKYCITAFLKGAFNITIYYFDGEIKHFLQHAFPIGVNFETQDYKVYQKYFDFPYEDKTVQIEIQPGVEGLNTKIGLFTINKVESPCFTILNIGQKIDNTQKLFFSPSNPSNTILNSYNDSFFGGAESNTGDMFEFYMNYIKPVGVKSIYKVLEKTVYEDEYAYVDDTTLVLPYGQIDEPELEVNRTIDNDTLKA